MFLVSKVKQPSTRTACNVVLTLLTFFVTQVLKNTQNKLLFMSLVLKIYLHSVLLTVPNFQVHQ
jgi:putative effector of murein hydrolase